MTKNCQLMRSVVSGEQKDAQVRNGLFDGTYDAQASFFIEERSKTLLREFSNAKGKRRLHCGTGQW